MYFGPEAREWAFKNFRCVHFTANPDKQELVESLRDCKISPKFREINPKFVKITNARKAVSATLSVLK